MSTKRALERKELAHWSQLYTRGSLVFSSSPFLDLYGFLSPLPRPFSSSSPSPSASLCPSSSSASASPSSFSSSPSSSSSFPPPRLHGRHPHATTQPGEIYISPQQPLNPSSHPQTFVQTIMQLPMQTNSARLRLYVNGCFLIVVETCRSALKSALARVQHGVIVRASEVDEHGELAFHGLVGAQLRFVYVGTEPGV